MSSNGAPPEGSRPDRATVGATTSTTPATAAEVICSALAGDLARLLENDPEVRRGVDAEAVHQARVATRRFRSQLRSFAAVLRKKETGKLATELKGLAGLLGAVRDLDVLRDRFAGATEPGLAVVAGRPQIAADASDDPGKAGAEPEPERETDSPGERGWRYALPVVPETVVAAVVALVERDRAFSFEVLLAEMESQSYVELLERVAAFVSSPPFRKSAARSAIEVIEPAALNAFSALAAAVGGLEPVPTDAALHEIRIRAKRARYAAQIASTQGGDGYDVLAKRLAKLQDTLGLLNDGSRATAWLANLRSAPTKGAAAAHVALMRSCPVPFLSGVDLLTAREHLGMAALRSCFAELWTRVAEAAEAVGSPGYEKARSMRARTSSSRRSSTSSDAMFSVT